MEWNDILSQIDFDESLSETEEISLRNILEDAYKRSSILRNYFSQFFLQEQILDRIYHCFLQKERKIFVNMRLIMKINLIIIELNLILIQ